MLPADFQIPVDGIYTSALSYAVPFPSCPPTTSTVPLGNNVAVWLLRAVIMLLVAIQDRVAGLYISALPSREPPAASTVPLGSNMAVCSARGVIILPVVAQTCVDGLYTSAVAKTTD